MLFTDHQPQEPHRSGPEAVSSPPARCSVPGVWPHGAGRRRPNLGPAISAGPGAADPQQSSNQPNQRPRESARLGPAPPDLQPPSAPSSPQSLGGGRLWGGSAVGPGDMVVLGHLPSSPAKADGAPGHPSTVPPQRGAGTGHQKPGLCHGSPCSLGGASGSSGL